MFTYVGTLIDTMLATYLTSTLMAVMGVLVPIVVAGQTLWMLLYGYDVLRGQVQEPVMTFTWKVIKVIFICAVALTASVYQFYVQDTTTGLTTGMVATFIPPGSTVNTTNIWTILDSFNPAASDLVLKATVPDESAAWRRLALAGQSLCRLPLHRCLHGRPCAGIWPGRTRPHHAAGRPCRLHGARQHLYRRWLHDGV